MKPKRYISSEIKRLHNLFLRLVSDVHTDIEELRDVTSLQGWVIGFLFYKAKNKDTFQKDIEAECNIRGSTATLLLKRMEKKGLIVREKLTEDARWKRIILTQKAKDICKLFEPVILKFEKQLSANLTQKELDLFFKVVDKICLNLEKSKK